MKQTFLYISWLIAAVATAGSLYFSNVLGLPPCSLCWWQRIFMYPLVPLFTIAFIRKDTNAIWYTTPLIFMGWIISTYHNLLYYNVIEEALTACTAEANCTSVQIEWLGFITIPLMAFTAFTLLAGISLSSIFKKENK